MANLGIIGILFVLLLALLLFVLFKLSHTTVDQSPRLMMDLLENMRRELHQKVDQLNDKVEKGSRENLQTIQHQFKESAGIIKDVTEKLTRLDETNKQVLDFSGKLQSLENILKNPKQRGILGEYFLETLLGNVLQPNQYKRQYKFSDGETVDAVIFYQDKLIPIDAKFSLEKYNKLSVETDPRQREQLEKEFKQDVKNRIEETSKYIRPRENTTEFAFMFIPAEGVYYNLLIYNVGTVEATSHDLVEYAFRKHVIIVSPTSFFAYLQTVLMGLHTQQVEENIKEIIERIGQLNKHLGNYEVYMQKLGKNLGATVGSYNDASKEFKKIDKDIYRLSDGKAGGEAELLLVDRPGDAQD